MHAVSQSLKVVQCVLVACLVGGPIAAGAQLYQSRPAGAPPVAGGQRPSTVAPTPVTSTSPAAALPEGVVDDPADDVVDQYLEDSFAMVEPDLRAGRMDAAIRRLMDSGKQGRAKDLLAALQMRFALRDLRVDPQADPVFVEAMQVLAQLSAARSPDAYFVAAVLYRTGTWMAKDAKRSGEFMQAAAAGGVRAASEMLKYPVR